MLKILSGEHTKYNRSFVSSTLGPSAQFVDDLVKVGEAVATDLVSLDFQPSTANKFLKFSRQ